MSTSAGGRESRAVSRSSPGRAARRGGAILMFVIVFGAAFICPPDLGASLGRWAVASLRLLRIALIVIAAHLLAAELRRGSVLRELLPALCVLAIAYVLTGDVVENVRGLAELGQKEEQQLSHALSMMQKNNKPLLKSAVAASKSAKKAEDSARESQRQATAATALATTAKTMSESATTLAAVANDTADVLRHHVKFDADDPSENSNYSVILYSTRPPSAGLVNALSRAGFQFTRKPGGLGTTDCKILYYDETAWDQAQCIRLILTDSGYRGIDLPPPTPYAERNKHVQVHLDHCRIVQVPPGTKHRPCNATNLKDIDHPSRGRRGAATSTSGGATSTVARADAGR